LLYNSFKVSNFHSSFSIAMKNCLIPSNVSSSFLTKILAGSLMNYFVISRISVGMVAENNAIWMSPGISLKISLIWSLNPLPSISSASSSTNNFKWSAFKCSFFNMSWTLPGVPTITCTPSFSFLISSPMLVPPVQMWTEIFRYSPKQRMTFWICWASSLVGAKTNAWHFWLPGSINYNKAIAKVAVFPVPDWACAIVSLDLRIGKIPFCWITEGLVKPYP